jgi:DNA-binding CsgD family transcriptional regulator
MNRGEAVVPHVAEQLVGRRPQLEILEVALAQVSAGSAAAVELMGEPGIGKTRLLAELAGRADGLGHLVLSGSASDLDSDAPFGMFVDALDDYLRGLDPRRLALLTEPVLAELATVFPALSSHAAGRDVALQHERYRSHQAVRELLEQLAHHQPLTLILDDAHWADAGSVELLGAMLRRLPAAPVLIAIAYRPRQLPKRLSIAFARAQRNGTLAHGELIALTRSEANELLGDVAASAERAGLYAESGGNPFYLQQLARALRRESSRPTVRAAVSVSDTEVPQSVIDALAEELALLSETARGVLEGAAVAGDPFDPEIAAAAAAVAESVVLEAINELMSLDLLRGTDVPRRFRFRHPLLRRAVYESTPGGWRVAAHGRCANAIAALGGSAVARAHHVENSARRSDPAAIAVLREAGEAAADRAPAQAARWFGAALRLMADSSPPAERRTMLTALAGAQMATGQFADAHSALLQALACLAEGEVTLRVALTAACAGLEQLLGRHDDAHSRLVGALATLDDRRSPQAAALLISLALDGCYRERYPDSRDWGVRALEVAHILDDPPLMAAASAVTAFAAAFDGAVSEAEVYRAEAAELVDSMSDAQLALRLDTMAYLSGAEVYLDRFAEAIAHGNRGLAVARKTAQGELLPILIQALATGLLASGRLTEAAELLDGSIEGARVAGNDQTLAWSLLNRAFLGVYMGDFETAAAKGAESMELTAALDDSQVSTYAAVIMGCLSLEMGDPARAVELFTTSAGGDALPRIPGGWRANYLGFLTRCRLQLGQREKARLTARYAGDVASSTGLGMARAWADRAAAAVALDAGDAEAAAAGALASAAGCDAAGAVVEAAISRVLAGRALALAGNTADAVTELEQAAKHGAARARLEAEQELRKLGRTTYRRSRPGAGEGVASLTGRELELARLVVDRRTNAEIAATLFLSQKTIETHLRNMFRKIGVTSRVELARAVERLEQD